jgi:hypothetical protein
MHKACRETFRAKRLGLVSSYGMIVDLTSQGQDIVRESRSADEVELTKYVSGPHVADFAGNVPTVPHPH